jgi:hypothetical protein
VPISLNAFLGFHDSGLHDERNLPVLCPSKHRNLKYLCTYFSEHLFGVSRFGTSRCKKSTSSLTLKNTETRNILTNIPLNAFSGFRDSGLREFGYNNPGSFGLLVYIFWRTLGSFVWNNNLFIYLFEIIIYLFETTIQYLRIFFWNNNLFIYKLPLNYFNSMVFQK